MYMAAFHRLCSENEIVPRVKGYSAKENLPQPGGQLARSALYESHSILFIPNLKVYVKYRVLTVQFYTGKQVKTLCLVAFVQSPVYDVGRVQEGTARGTGMLEKCCCSSAVNLTIPISLYMEILTYFFSAILKML